MRDTRKILSEALIFASTNPQYEGKLFIELQVQYMKIPSSNLGRTCCVQKLFLTLRTIFEHNMFSSCSAKRRASDKDLPVLLCAVRPLLLPMDVGRLAVHVAYCISKKLLLANDFWTTADSFR